MSVNNRKNCEIGRKDAVMATIEDLKSWMERDIARFGDLQTHLNAKESECGKSSLYSIYTDTNSYAITARESKTYDEGYLEGYLGCVASVRKPRAGEDWHRGNDLADGPLTEETWHQILGDIVSYEMVRVHRKEDALKKAEIQYGKETGAPAVAVAGHNG